MGTGYTRNDTANNIADGNVINASDLDGEFDAIQGAFNGSTGHSHDGTSGEGPKIDTGGLADDAVTAAILDETATFTMAGLSVTGNTTLGDAATDTVTVTADVASSLTPSADDTYDLGASGSEWRNLYIDGTANIDTLSADSATLTTADINGGSVDGVTIGTNSAVTDLRVDNIKVDGNTISSTDTNGNIAITPDGTGEVDISKVDIDAGAIDGVTIGTNSAVTELQVDNINVNGNAITSTDTNGNIALTPNGTGEVDISKVDIDAGAIDGVTIGTNSAVTELQVDNININGNTISSTDTNGNITLAPNGTGEVNLADSDKLTFGAGSDLQIYHDGSASYVSDQGTGNLKVLGTNIELKNAADTASYLVASNGGSIQLYNNGAKKFETTSTGVDITGELQADSLDIDGTVDIDGATTITTTGNGATLTLESTDDDANQGPLLTMFRNSASPADSDLVGKIAFTAEDSAGNETGYAIMQSRIRDVTDGTEDGELRIDIRKGGTVTESLTLKENETVINEAGVDTDFRVESDGNANAIKVDAGNDRVGILNASPSTALDVTGTITATGLDVNGAGDISGNLTLGGDFDGSGHVKSEGADGGMILRSWTNNSAYGSLATNGMSSAEYIIISDGTDTYLSSGASGTTSIRGPNNGTTAQIAVGASQTDVTGPMYVTGNIGRDSTDYIAWTNNSRMDFYVNGNNEARLESDGDWHADGNVIAYSTTISDPRLKENIEPVTDALAKVEQLNGYTFTYKADGVESAGVMSTEVKEVLPSAIKQSKLSLKLGDDNETEYDIVQYDQLHALLIEAVKELSARVKELEDGTSK